MAQKIVKDISKLPSVLPPSFGKVDKTGLYQEEIPAPKIFTGIKKLFSRKKKA